MAGHLDAFDCSRFTHARGPATDTPGHLRALLGDDARAFVAGYSHLWSETLRPDGGAWSVTAPVALVVTEFLDDPRLGPDDPSMRDAMLAYLHRVAVVGDLGEDAEMFRARGEQSEALACYDRAPEILAKVLPHLQADRSRQRICAAAAVGRLARHPSAATLRHALIEQIEEMTALAECPYDRATLVFAIGDLGGVPRHWLNDPIPAVRGSAALAATLADDEASTSVLLALSRSPRAFGESLGGMAVPLQFMVPPYPDLIAEVLVQRVDSPPALISGALAAVTLSQRSIASSLAPYLPVFFPDGDPQPQPNPLQQTLARAIAEREELWSLPEEARTALFARCGISADRAIWSAIATCELPISEYFSGAQIVALEWFTAIRMRPGMYFGVRRTDPTLPDRIVRALRTEYEEAVAAGLVESFAVEIEPPARLVIDVHGHNLPGTESADSIDLNHVFGRSANPWPALHLSMVSALSRRVAVQVWVSGRVFASNYVDGIALDAVKELNAEGNRAGYRVTFELDSDWLPTGSRLSDDIPSAG
ncbi:hypothetical protein [Streptomyces sp. RKAG293]|uniref:hypothetical protein n=1 Tax=Streptomyces sp. RKAG293 TaxID=2893403 RepID=UPI002034A772|nr:hypothetical protein [Streptomyces sp. RKAG293]MCM2417704.1 hypothetical protein [Streptomyces sp. RKAG293]